MLAAAGVCSRRRAETFILEGRVTVNGQVVTLLGTQVDPAHDVVMVDGALVSLTTRRTFLLNKPAGYITTCEDPHARDTVMRLAPRIPGLHPIGRLDKDTTGLLLLTNDGDLTFALTHPKHHVEKTYLARVTGVPVENSLDALRQGVVLGDGMTSPADVRLAGANAGEGLVEITIHEGRKRQVRRMLSLVGHPVVTLTRLRVGPLALGDLPEGVWRELTAEEIGTLYQAAGVAQGE